MGEPFEWRLTEVVRKNLPPAEQEAAADRAKNIPSRRPGTSGLGENSASSRLFLGVKGSQVRRISLFTPVRSPRSSRRADPPPKYRDPGYLPPALSHVATRGRAGPITHVPEETDTEAQHSMDDFTRHHKADLSASPPLCFVAIKRRHLPPPPSLRRNGAKSKKSRGSFPLRRVERFRPVSFPSQGERPHHEDKPGWGRRRWARPTSRAQD